MKILIYITMFLASGIWLSSCRTQYIPIETINTEVKYRDRLQRDSVHVHDSIYIRDNGDTVFVDRWHTVYKDRFLRDTSYVYITDSIQVPYPVEKELNRWQSLKMELGGWAFGIAIAFILMVVGCIIYRRKT